MARPKKFNQDHDLGTVTIRMPAELLKTIDSELAERKNRGEKSTRSDYIREACEVYADLIRCPKCGALNNKKADTCAECSHKISEELYLRKEVANLFSELFSFMSEICRDMEYCTDVMEKYPSEIRLIADAYFSDSNFVERYGGGGVFGVYEDLSKKYPKDSYILDGKGWHQVENKEGMIKTVDKYWKMFQSLDETRTEDEETKEMRPLRKGQRLYMLRGIEQKCKLLWNKLFADMKLANSIYGDFEYYVEIGKEDGMIEKDEYDEEEE